MDKLSIEVRMLIAVILAMAVVTIGSYFSPSPEPQPEPAVTQEAPAETGNAPAPVNAARAEASPAAGAEAASTDIAATDVINLTIETDLHKVVFSNRGATVVNWVLKKYEDNAGEPLELVNQRALQLKDAQAVPAPFSVSAKSGRAGALNSRLFQVTRGADGMSVSFEYAEGSLRAKKTFEFAKDSYLVKVTSEVIDNGVLVPHSLMWRGGFGDVTGVNPTSDDRTLYFDTANSSLEKQDVGDAEDGPVSASGNYAFAGIEDKYFASVALPGEGNSMELTTYADNVPNQENKAEAHIGAGLGGSGALNFQLYVGPKDATFLRDVDPRLEQMIDWGWFFFLARPIFAMLHWTVDHLTHNWGWAIVLLTIVINTVLFPLRLSSMKSSRKMQAIQPQVKKINEKYQGMAMTDPRKANQNQELMDLYKAHDINPVGGCLPMVLQIPFFYALYKVLSITIELRGAEWLWIGDLSQPEVFAIRFLPLLLVVTQFLSQKMTPSPGMDPSQQKIMMFMPLLFGYMFWYASAGLVLYWLTSNVVSIAQQWLLNRNTPAPAVAVVVPPKKKK